MTEQFRIPRAACRAAALILALGVLYNWPGLPGVTAQSSEEGETAPAESAKTVDYKTLKSPVSYTDSSIRRGRIIFVRTCTECHGPDGKALIDLIADATDLTQPKYFVHGTSEGEIFRSIRDGAGDNMPPYRLQIRREEDMWHLVNFIRSLWPKSMRPALQEEEQGEKPAADTEDSEQVSADGGIDHEK